MWKTSSQGITLPLVVVLGLMRAERLKIGQWPILVKEPGCRAGSGMRRLGITIMGPDTTTRR